MQHQQVPQNILKQVNKLITGGKNANAASLLQELCLSFPENAGVYYLLGYCLGRLGQWAEAIQALQQSIKLRPDIAQSHQALGASQLALKQYDAAANSLRQALDLDNTLTNTHIDLANICLALEDFSQSRHHYQQALKQNPTLSAAYYGLGCIEEETGNDDRAIELLKKALELQPDSVNALCMLGSALQNQSQIEESAACYERALQIDPDSVQAVVGILSIYEFRGETRKAIKLIEPLLQKHDNNPALGIAYARLSRHTKLDEKAVDYINKTLESPEPISTRIRRNLHFAVADVLDKLQQFDAAFPHYKIANDTDTQLYDAVGHAQLINKTISAYNPELYLRLPRTTLQDSRPVFILGMPRSGTSLTEQILAAHPDVHAAGELDTLGRIVKEVSRKPDQVANLGQQDLDNMAGNYLAHIENLASNALRITDKMPYNFYYIGLIQLLFPGGRIIHCTRNPLDNGLSIYFQNFASEHGYAKRLFDIGTHYRQYQRLMTHWKKILTLPLLEVNYEQLVNDQEAVTRQMLEFCELEWDENCLQFHKFKRNVLTASYDQVRQPLYNQSVERWRNYEKYIDELREGLQHGY